MGFVTNIFEKSIIYLQTIMGDILKVLALFLIGWWLINKFCRLIPVFFKKSNSDMGVASFLESVIKFSCRIVLIMIILGCLGFNVAPITTALAASLVTIGIALKDNISNLVSGIILVINKPLRVGDYIECDGVKGTVVRIEMMFTILKMEEENHTAVIPNNKLTSSSIVRVSKFNSTNLSFEYVIDFPSNKSKSVHRYLEKTFLLSNKILHIPAPTVNIKSLEENKIQVNIDVWCEVKDSEFAKKDIAAVIEKIKAYNTDVSNS